MFVYFEVAGDVLINRQMLRMSQYAGDMAIPLEAVGEEMLKIEQLQFDTEGGRVKKWAPIKDSTIARKEAQGLDLRILHATLELEKSLTQRGGANIFYVTTNMLIFGSSLPYAAVHQNPKPSNPLPRRRPIDFKVSDKVGFVKTLQRFIVMGDVIPGSQLTGAPLTRKLNVEMGQAIL